MEIRIRESGEIVNEKQFRLLFPNTSFPPLTAEILNDYGADVILEGPQPQTTIYQAFYRDGIQEIDGNWYTKYTVNDLDAESIALIDAEQERSIRIERNKLLAECDWTQLLDSNVDKEAWAIYRQALRDIPSKKGFPLKVKWPTIPA